MIKQWSEDLDGLLFQKRNTNSQMVNEKEFNIINHQEMQKKKKTQ